MAAGEGKLTRVKNANRGGEKNAKTKRVKEKWRRHRRWGRLNFHCGTTDFKPLTKPRGFKSSSKFNGAMG